MVSINCFKKENLHCIWDDSLAGKEAVFADSLSALYDKLERNGGTARAAAPSPDSTYPFMDDTGSIWRFAYIPEPPTDDINNDAVKNGYRQGHTVLRRYVEGEWEVMDDTCYFDLPGYEYKVSYPTTPRVSNKALAEWLIRGMGLLINAESRRICTSYDFPADDMYGEVPSGYKVMPIGTDDWLEPTEDVVCAQ